jgi:hypothetical protein
MSPALIRQARLERGRAPVDFRERKALAPTRPSASGGGPGLRYGDRIGPKSSICRLEHVVAVLVWEQTSLVGERQPAIPLAPGPDDPVVAFFGRNRRVPTRLLSCYYRSNLLGRPSDAPIDVDQPEGAPVSLSARDWETLLVWLKKARPSDAER